MNRNSWKRCGRVCAVMMIVAFALLISLSTDLQSASADEGPEIRLVGLVLAVPGGENGIGTWTIRGHAEDDEAERTWTVIANAETEFDSDMPGAGENVKIEGLLTGHGEIIARKIRPTGSDDSGRDLEGVVLTPPGSVDGIGEWTIQTDREQVLSVSADANTRFDDGIPLVGDWVEVRGQRQIDGSIQAARIKVDDYENSQLVVRLESNVISSTVASRHGLVPHSALLSSGEIYLFVGDEDVADLRGLVVQVRNDPDVTWAELNYVGGAPVGSPYRTWGWGGTEPTEYVNQDAFVQVNLDDVGDKFPGDDVIVAVLDTGIDLDHPAFSGRLLPGLDLIDDDATPSDVGNGLGWGHGTHTSGVIAKVAPSAQLLPVRVLDTNARGNTFLLAYGIEWAVGQGADVINLSLGTPYDSKVLHDTIRQARQQGVVVVAAVGNGGDDIPQYPAAYPDVTAVTAVDGENVKADFANYGEHWVDIAAPGTGIVSAIVGAQGSGYATWSGTSMAAPFVSGAAARVRDQQASHSPSPIRQRLLNHMRDINPENPDYIDQLGGLLDVASALGVEDSLSTRTFLPLVLH